MPAVVAHQAIVGRVVGQIDAAVRTLGDMTALTTGDHAVCTTAVEEENGLLSPASHLCLHGR